MRRHLLPCSLLGLALCLPSHAGDKGHEVKIEDFKATTPATWKLKETKVPFRLYTFTLPKGEGDDRDTEVVVSHTGKGAGGGLKENVTRWQDMFIPPKGKSIEDVTKTEEIKVAGVAVTIVDIEGTYKEKSAPFASGGKTTLRPDSRRVNVIFASENGPFFMYMVGPAKTVASHKEAFDKWLKSFK
jgi:hypothetical protein